MSKAPTLPEQVFSDADSEWNTTREILERALVQAAVELLAHTCASAMRMDDRGVSLEVRRYDTH